MLSAEAIRVANLQKRYGDTIAIADLSLTVPRGRMFGFLGPNGSGKSTTIGCLTGLLDPTAGSVEVLGEELTDGGVALKRRIGVMPETLGLFDPLYADEFLAFTARMFGLSEEDTSHRVTGLLTAFGLTDVRSRIGDYSTGMRKRLAFAAAVIHSPDVLFLDEPFEGIDPSGVTLMKTWLRRFTDQGGTVFLTSHVLEMVERLCTDVAIITKPGRLVWQGDITPLADNGVVRSDDKEFDTLETLFLHFAGGRHFDLAWF